MSQAYAIARSNARVMVDQAGQEVYASYPSHYHAILERLALTDKLVELLEDFVPNRPMPPAMRTKLLLLMEDLA